MGYCHFSDIVLVIKFIFIKIIHDFFYMANIHITCIMFKYIFLILMFAILLYIFCW